MDFKGSAYAGSRSRKSHTKSRLGCANCKQRRVKCDEIQPECSNCIRHSIKCNYGQTSSRTSSKVARSRTTVTVDSNEKQPDGYKFISSTPSGFNVPRRGRSEDTISCPQQTLSPGKDSESAVAKSPFKFTATDMILFHHLLSADDLKGHIPDHLIQLGFSVHYVLHLLLAVSGYHLKRTSTSHDVHRFLQSDMDFYAEAERNLNAAVAQVSALNSDLNQENCHILYFASLFIFICSLARGPQTGEYLAFRDDQDMPGLSLFTGVRLILESSNNFGTSPAISSVHPSDGGKSSLPEERGSESNDLYSSETLSHHIEDHAPTSYTRLLESLKNLIFQSFSPNDPRRFTYYNAFELLDSRYNSIFADTTPVSVVDLWPLIFSWLYKLPDEVVHDIQQKHPVALLLFSYFAVLLNQLDWVWFIKGWPLHIVEGISRNLDEYHRSFMTWPLDHLGIH